MNDLKISLDALPQELYNHIFDLTFTASTSDNRTIDDNFKPPSSLQVSRGTRNQFAQSYYGGSTFYIYFMDKPRYLNCLRQEHFSQISEIRINSWAYHLKPLQQQREIASTLFWFLFRDLSTELKAANDVYGIFKLAAFFPGDDVIWLTYYEFFN